MNSHFNTYRNVVRTQLRSYVKIPSDEPNSRVIVLYCRGYVAQTAALLGTMKIILNSMMTCGKGRLIKILFVLLLSLSVQ